MSQIVDPDKFLSIVQERRSRPANQTPWRELARPQQLRPDNVDVWALIGGRGCVSGDTLIYDPISGEERPIGALAVRGEAVFVLGLHPNGDAIPILCEAPFIKGRDPMFKITTQTGHTVTCTNDHQFLTDEGWKRLGDITDEEIRVTLDTPENYKAAYQAWSRIVSREPVGERYVYDIHVPNVNNYLAQGIWHHNSGKTRAGAEDALERMRDGVSRIHVVAPTFGDARDVCIEGPSGILACARWGEVETWNRSFGELKFKNGTMLKIFAAVEPDRLNGPQCFVAGTLVDTTQGKTPIELLEVGDIVRTRFAARRIVRTSHRVAKVGRTIFSNGSILEGTADHPILSDGEWVKMGDLRVGDPVYGKGNPTIIREWTYTGEQPVYCLTVDQTHEYFANGILVHNCGHLWCDEFGLYGGTEAIDMALFGLRLGDRVTQTYTSTPKMGKSTRYVVETLGAHVTRMTMRDNIANLASGVVEKLEAKYKGTRLGRQELEGEMLEEVQGALWLREWMDREGFRVDPVTGYDSKGKAYFKPHPKIVRTVVALDPTVADPERKRNPHKEMDACGIIVAGIDTEGQGYVMGRFTEVLHPADWARLAVKLYNFFRASCIVAEANQGGELIREIIKGVSSGIPVRLVHASMGKRPRAEPVALLYEQGRVKHCGEFRELEDQMLTWDASDPSARSPNDIDALVWAFHGLELCDATVSRVTKRVQSAR